MRIISVGKKPDPAISSLISEYEKRLRGKFRLEFIRLKPSVGTEQQIRQRDSANIINTLRPSDRIVLLDERGSSMSSEKFAALLEESDEKTTFIVGGAFGVDQELQNKASIVLRLSDFVLPHQLALVLLVEQLYRAQSIIDDHPYHHS